MSFFAFIKVFILSVSFVYSDGGMSSSGGEFVTTEKNPWYIGDRAVNYCIVANKDFSVDKYSAADVIKNSLNSWTQLINKLNPQQTSFLLPDGYRKKLTTEFKEISCSDSPELKFYLGHFDSFIDLQLKTHAKYIVAFAAHQGINDFDGRAKNGVVWITPDLGKKKYQGPVVKHNFWTARNTLSNVLLHEIGHIFGFEHKSDGVMNEMIPAAAVASGDTLKLLNLNHYLYHNLLNKNVKVCGENLVLSDEFVEEVLESNLVTKWNICYEKKDSSSNIILEISAEDNFESYKFHTRLVDLSQLPASNVMGRYFKNKVGNFIDYERHSFISFYNFTISGYLDVGKNQLPIILNKKENKIELYINKNNKLYSVNFYIEGLGPLFNN